jgi:hypothetical protein
MAAAGGSSSGQSVDREQLRRELLKLIIKSEAARRDQRKATEK